MEFVNPWGLLGLISLPTIAAIHLFHRRHPPLYVAGVHLWGVENRLQSAGRRKDRLPITSTLLLELLAALLLTLILSQPRIKDWQGVEHLVVVLDQSASMQGQPAGGPDFRTAAANRLRQEFESRGRNCVASLICTGRRPAMLAGPAVDWEEAFAALKDWRPEQPEHDFRPAWDLARQLAENTGEMIFLTDHLPAADAPLPKGMRVISVGRGLDNVAVTTARWSLDPQTLRGKVYLRIANFGKEAAEVEVKGVSAGKAVFQQTVQIRPQATLPLETVVAGGLGVLRVTIHREPDGLAIDNQVTLVEPRSRTVKVAVLLGKEHSALAAIERVLGQLPSVEVTREIDSAQLAIAPVSRVLPGRADLWWLGIGPADLDEEARKQALDLVGPYLLEKRNPLLEGVTLDGIVWGGVGTLDQDLTPIVSAGKRFLLALDQRTSARTYLLNIDLSRSNLQDSPDWPILISNLVELRRDNLPGLRRWSYRLQDEIRFRLFEAGTDEALHAGERELTLRHGETVRPLAHTSLVEIPPLQETGIYEVRYGEETVGRFAVNLFDEHESQLANLAPGIRADADDSTAELFQLDQPFSWLMMLALALVLVALFADWKVLQVRSE